MIDYILSVFRCDYIAIHNAGLLLRRHLLFGIFILRRACRHDIARASMLLCNKCCLIGCRSDAIVDTLFVVCRAVYFFQSSVFRGKQTFISAIAHAKLSNFFYSFGQRLILICDFLRICAYLYGDICTTYTKCVRLRFARTHLSRSEVLACLQLSYCFASIHI